MGRRIKHLKVVLRHKRYVFHECRKCGHLLLGLKHDLSKFSPAEFGPSARYFQGSRSPLKAEKEEKGYSYAWQHHHNHNPHHWQYWLDYDDEGNLITVKMPYKYVVELMCDWIGAGKAYNAKEWTLHKPMDFYFKKLKERHLHPDTDHLVYLFCDIIEFYGMKAFYDAARNKALREFYEKGNINQIRVKGVKNGLQSQICMPVFQGKFRSQRV